MHAIFLEMSNIPEPNDHERDSQRGDNLADIKLVLDARKVSGDNSAAESDRHDSESRDKCDVYVKFESVRSTSARGVGRTPTP